MALGIPIVGKLLDGALGLIGGNQQARNDLEKAEAEERQDGYKDDLALLVLTAVFIACFIPGAQPYIERGFQILDKSTPPWFQDLFFWGYASALGLMQIKKLFRR